MKTILRAIGLALPLLTSFIGAARACPHSVESSANDANVSFDRWTMDKWSCTQSFIDYTWNEYDFDKEDWDNGRGFEDPCNVDLPLARTLNAIWLLHNALPDWARNISPEPEEINLLRWAPEYTSAQIDELDARCEDDARATTEFPPIFDNKTILKTPFFYGEDVVQRVGTLFHEARHAEGRGHDGDYCADHASCDNTFGDNGANTFQVRWLRSYAKIGQHGSLGMRKRAIDEANYSLSHRFNQSTPFFISDAEGGNRLERGLELGLTSVSGQERSADGRGFFENFANWKGLYELKGLPARLLGGGINARYLALGGPNGFLGFPVTDEQNYAGRQFWARFEHGALSWTEAHGVFYVWDGIYRHWLANGAETGRLGSPMSDPLATGIPEYDVQQVFEGGVIFWSTAKQEPFQL
jgi:hypothetical protein